MPKFVGDCVTNGIVRWRGSDRPTIVSNKKGADLWSAPLEFFRN